MNVPRPERIPHQLEEEDRSTWVVFSKTLGKERVLLRFPEDPTYRSWEGKFKASSAYLGGGSFSLFAWKKKSPGNAEASREIFYQDLEAEGKWVRERHIETAHYFYVLSSSHPVDNAFLFHQFADSFEIERDG